MLGTTPSQTNESEALTSLKAVESKQALIETTVHDIFSTLKKLEEELRLRHVQSDARIQELLEFMKIAPALPNARTLQLQESDCGTTELSSSYNNHIDIPSSVPGQAWPVRRDVRGATENAQLLAEVMDQFEDGVADKLASAKITAVAGDGHPLGVVPAKIDGAKSSENTCERDAQNPDWLTSAQITKSSYKLRAWFYIGGVIDNQRHRRMYMSLQGELETLNRRAELLADDDFENESEDQQLRARNAIGPLAGLKQVSSSRQAAEAIARCVDAKQAEQAMHSLEKLILKSQLMMRMADCPLDDFLEHYMSARDSALEQSGEKRRRACVKGFVRSVAEFNLLCSYLKVAIDLNDSIAFRVLLMVLNGLTLLGQYTWNYVISPERVYKCKFD